MSARPLGWTLWLVRCGQFTRKLGEFNFSRGGMPLPSVWGPYLWAVLHRIGYRAGKAPDIMARDEKRELDWLFAHLETIVPCVECRQHIEEYRKVHGIPVPADCGRWMWEFHEDVNRRLGKTSVPYSGDLGSPGHALQTNKSLRRLWREYCESIFESVQMGNLPGKNLTEFGRHLFLWQGFAGF
jgi:hypothetical protein